MHKHLFKLRKLSPLYEHLKGLKPSPSDWKSDMLITNTKDAI